MGVEQRAAAISRIDGRIGLNPGARAGARELSDGADDAFSDTEKHGIARVADREDTLPLANGGGIGEREMREFTFLRGRRNFDEGDVEIRIDVNNFGLKLPAGGEQGVQRF